MQDLINFLPTILISIIGYFLAHTMNDIRSLKTLANEMEKKLSVIENDYLNKHKSMNDRFEELNINVKDLTKEIQALNKEIIKIIQSSHQKS